MIEGLNGIHLLLFMALVFVLAYAIAKANRPKDPYSYLRCYVPGCTALDIGVDTANHMVVCWNHHQLMHEDDYDMLALATTVGVYNPTRYA